MEIENLLEIVLSEGNMYYVVEEGCREGVGDVTNLPLTREELFVFQTVAS